MPKKKSAGEIEEIIDATGQESETKAAKWIEEIGKEDDHYTQEVKARDLETLEKKNQFKIIDYWQALADIMTRVAHQEEFPKGWRHHVFIDTKGIVFVLYSPDNRKFVRAMKPSHEPTYDFTATDKFMESAWVAINSWKTQI